MMRSAMSSRYSLVPAGLADSGTCLAVGPEIPRLPESWNSKCSDSQPNVLPPGSFSTGTDTSRGETCLAEPHIFSRLMGSRRLSQHRSWVVRSVVCSA